MDSTKRCDRCETEQADVSLATDRFGTLCQPCHAVHVKYEAAGDSLLEVVQAWAGHWVEAGLSREEVFDRFDSWPREITGDELFARRD